MRISLLCIGKTNDKRYTELMDSYEKKLPPFISFERIELPGVKLGKNIDKTTYTQREADSLMPHLHKQDTLILLDEKGLELDSMGFAGFLQNKMNLSTHKLVFIVGGAYGFHNSVHQLAHAKISLSKMTFTHQMVRLFFTEQLYRAFSIIQNKSYHHE